MNTPKTAIVTGASSGIGLAVAKAYLDMGYNVVGNGRSRDRLEQAAARLGSPDNFLLVDGDIGDPETTKNLFARAIEAFGKVDILIANAGIFISKPVTDFTVEEVDAVIDTNIKGFFYPVQAAAEHMRANGSGHIVAISACIAMQPNAKLPALMSVLAKGGINHAVRGLAIELGDSGVHVNAVAPGIIDTPIFGRDEELWQFLRTLAPNGKTGDTQDIVDAILYLTGSNYVTGSIMTVDGGSTAGTW